MVVAYSCLTASAFPALVHPSEIGPYLTNDTAIDREDAKGDLEKEACLGLLHVDSD